MATERKPTGLRISKTAAGFQSATSPAHRKLAVGVGFARPKTHRVRRIRQPQTQGTVGASRAGGPCADIQTKEIAVLDRDIRCAYKRRIRTRNPRVADFAHILGTDGGAGIEQSTMLVASTRVLSITGIRAKEIIPRANTQVARRAIQISDAGLADFSRSPDVANRLRSWRQW